MIDHLLAIEEIIKATSTEDWQAVISASSRIATSPQVKKMCEHMGAGAEGFTEQALAFHHNAYAIAPSAKKKDRKAVLAATAKTLQSCNSCHRAFKQDVVNAATWQKRTETMHRPLSHLAE